EQEPENSDERRSPKQDCLSAEAICQPRRERDRQSKKDNAEHLNRQELLARITEIADPPAQCKNRHQIKQNERRQRAECTENEQPEVMRKHGCQGYAHAFVLLDRLFECRSLRNPKTHVESDEHQYRAGYERN